MYTHMLLSKVPLGLGIWLSNSGLASPVGWVPCPALKIKSSFHIIWEKLRSESESKKKKKSLRFKKKKKKKP